jgi:uncharacterized protein (DUF433 family)
VSRIPISHPHVVMDNGVPLVIGSRVLVARLWGWHRAGTKIETLFMRYPQLGEAAILDALSFAYDNRSLFEEQAKAVQP